MDKLNNYSYLKFEKYGYLIIKSVIDNSIIDEIIEEIYEKNPENKNLNRIVDAWKEHDIIGYLAFNSKITNILYNLYDRKPIPFQSLNFYNGTEQKLHSDQIHFCSDPINLMCGVWIALEDISMDSGPLIFYPKSHKLPFYTMQSLNIEPGNYSQYEYKMEKIMNKLNLKPEYGNINKGDIIIWHANLIHGGSKRINMGLTRKSLVIHYFFENCKYWTPLFSSENNIVYRNTDMFIDTKFNISNTDDLFKYAKLYKERYHDLQDFTDEEAIEHYYKYGIVENRIF
jgi:ectoine hydroxylase-related dioxygenase (phytanoyl-CoA dioxygenase family)